MPTKTLSRRSMLRGAAGAALCLPALEAMMPRTARAAEEAIPKRYVFTYGGTSSGRYRTNTEGDMLVPSSYGELSTVGADMYALQPLVEHGVLDDVSLVSNLLIPWGPSEGSLAPGGRLTELDFHFGPTVTPQLSGLKALVKGKMFAPSSEQRLVEAMSPDTTFSSLNYRVQPVDYLGGNGGSAGRISFRRDGDSIIPMDPIVSPQLAYQNLFSSFQPPDASPAALAAMQRRLSVLDRVSAASRDLMATLGSADRERLQRHLHEIEMLEAQLQASPPQGSEHCMMLDDPGADPQIGGTHDGSGELGGGSGWSDENRRAALLTDLTHMALTCELSHYAALQYTNWKSWMSAKHLEHGLGLDIHEIGHNGSVPAEAMGDVVAWHIRHFARLVRLLKDTPQWDGSSLLDHTALVLCFEGGHGTDPLSGSYSTHSTENMSVLVAGGAGGLRRGLHIDGEQRHPAQATLSAMEAVGYTGAFGDFSEGIDQLFG